MLQNTQQYQICILGSANSDHFLEVNDFPKEGETIAAKVNTILKQKSYIKNGGKGANQAVASALLGSKAIFAGQIGKDEIGQLLVYEMSNANVILTGLRKVDEQTGQAIILLNHKGDNLIIIVSGANGAYETLTELPEEYLHAINNSDFLQMQMEIPQKINMLAAKMMTKEDKFTMLDCGGKAEKLNEEFLRDLTLISPNETELERIIGEELDLKQDDLDAYLEKVVRQKLLVKYEELIVLLKLGASGSMLITKDFSVRCPSVTQRNPKILDDYKIVDTVGAGDCFTSAFCTHFYNLVKKHCNEVRVSKYKLLSEDIKKHIAFRAMTYGSAAAFLCITQHGAMPSMPKSDVVDEFIAKY